MNRPIPVTIVTGFLGSGKTTLLTSLIKNRQARRLALLINEFGEVSVDGAIVRARADQAGEVQIHDFPHGLIAYGDDDRFVPAMQALAAHRAIIDHVLIETSGLALPTAVMERLQAPELAGDFILDAALAVVDTPQMLSDRLAQGTPPSSYASVATLFAQQLEYADVVVLNKIDQLDEAALLAAEAQVRQLAPNVRFLELAYNATLDMRLALGLRLHQATVATHGQRYTPLATMPAPNAPPLTRQAPLDGHAHSGLAPHAHGLMTHKHFHQQDPGWLSFVLRSHEPQKIQRLKPALVELARAEPILRTKGFVHAADAAGCVLVQGVRQRVALTDAGDAPAAQSELVFIGYHLDRTAVATMLSRLTDTQWR